MVDIYALDRKIKEIKAMPLDDDSKVEMMHEAIMDAFKGVDL